MGAWHTRGLRPAGCSGVSASHLRRSRLGQATVPQLVHRAYAVARAQGFALTRAEASAGRPSACLPGVGQFLAMLAAGCHGGVIAEFGTGAGIGAAWIASAMPGDCTLVTAELDGALAAAAAELFADDARVQVLSGDASAVLPPDSPVCASDVKRELFAGQGGLTWTEVVQPDLANSLLVGTRR